MRYSLSGMFHRELKKGSAELLILSLVEDQPRHGYDLCQLIERRSDGALRFKGRWVEKGGRRRRFYRITAAGRHVLAAQREGWKAFVEAIRRITRIEHA